MASSNDGYCTSADRLVRDFEVIRLAITPLSALIFRAYEKSWLAALAIPDPLRRQRWVPASPRGQHTDR